MNLYSYNFLTFTSFLITFYLKSFLNIYYCTLTSLERWNLSFLSSTSFAGSSTGGSSSTFSLNNRYFWRKLLIYATFFLYLLFIVTCTGYTIVKFNKWSILILPFFYTLTLVWLLFQVLNIINLNNLLNKINDCYLLLNESNSVMIESGSGHHHHHHHHHHKSRMAGGSGANNLRSSSTSSSTSSHLSSSKSSQAKGRSRLLYNLRKFLHNFLNYNKLNGRNLNDDDIGGGGNSNIPIHRILSYKGVRHLGSISYRICIYCLTLTILLSVFVILTQSSLTIMLYLCILNINFIWLSLLYQFSKNKNGNCVAYALVAPPLILNVYTNNTLNSTTTNTFGSTMSSSKKYKTAQSTLLTTASSNTYSSNTTSGVSSSGSSNQMAASLPFNYQQALTQRCNFILNKFQAFLQYHQIENYGCDFASNGLNKMALETKLRAFFKKRTIPSDPNSLYYNTYLLYYCGPTSPLTDNLAFIDGNELSIEEICNIWREVHCKTDPAPAGLTEVKVVGINEETVFISNPV